MSNKVDAVTDPHFRFAALDTYFASSLEAGTTEKVYMYTKLPVGANMPLYPTPSKHSQPPHTHHTGQQPHTHLYK